MTWWRFYVLDWRDTSNFRRSVAPNPRMQPTGGEALPSVRPQGAVSALWNVGLCGRRPDGLQLMRKSLGGQR
jgi:hypothetical protein